MQDDAYDREQVIEDPERSNCGQEHTVTETVVVHNVRVTVYRDGESEKAARQITRRDEPALSPTRRTAHIDGVPVQPFHVQHKSNALLHICNDEVEDEYEELVRPRLLGAPDESVGQAKQ